MLSAIEYGKGRTSHTCMRHMYYPFESVDFIATFQRGSEWAVTKKVTQAVLTDYPDKDFSNARKGNK